MEDQIYASIVAYLTDQSYPPNSTKVEKRALRQRASRFELRDGRLWHPENHVEVIASSEKNRILNAIHAGGVGGSHFGRDKTISKVQCLFLFLKISQDFC